MSKTNAQYYAEDVEMNLRRMAINLRKDANELDNFADLINEMIKSETPITYTFVSNVARVITQALMNNNNMGRLENAVGSAALAVKAQEDSK